VNKRICSDSNEISVEIENLWKIFGKNPEQILNSELKSAPKGEVLEKTGHVVAVSDVSFSVKRGEFFVIMGLSGSGKSTLIRLLLRLIEPTSGSICIHGEDICAFDNKQLVNLRRHTTSMVFQHFGLLPHRNVLENVAYGLKVRGEEKEDRLKKARQAIDTVGLKGWEEYMPHNLSGGMQQRVGLARALANEPEILLMDEPFSGLDPLIRRQMQDELWELQEKVRKTILFVTHDLNEALKMGDRIAIMRDGRIIQIGTPEEVLSTPADTYVAQFVQDASPAKVLSAHHIMDDPDTILYEWQGPKAALQLLKDADADTAFVLSRSKKLLGIVSSINVAKIARNKDKTIKEAIEEATMCTPETMVEDLFKVAAECDYPIAVVGEDGKLLGEIQTSAILLSMSQEKVDETNTEEIEAS
jgi:glycine betaine/proline transport system ATP-binding protein